MSEDMDWSDYVSDDESFDSIEAKDNITIMPIIITEKIPDRIGDVIQHIQTSIDSIQNNPKKKTGVLKMLEEFKKNFDDYIGLDEDLRDYMGGSGGQIIPYNEFESKQDEISSDSLIVYIKNAQIYKVYNPEQLDKFEYDESTHYHKREYGPTYEVVRDKHPQKILIVVKDDIRGDALRQIKNSIIESVKTNPMYSDITVNDLRAYSNENDTEFILNNVKVKNMEQKEKIIERLIVSLKKTGNTEVANKIIIRAPPCDVENVRLHKLPSCKTSLDSVPMKIIDQLITSNSQATVNILGSIHYTVINNHNSNNTNCSNVGDINVSKNTSAKNTKKTLKSFYEFLYETRPDWYLEGKLVHLETICNAYNLYFNSDISRATLVKRLNPMFTGSKRVSGATMKKLATYATLKKLYS